MAAHENLSEYQFRYRPTGPQREWLDGDYFSDELEEGQTLYDHAVHAVHKPSGERVGQMLYHQEGNLFQISVDDEHQRRGVATGMVKHARKVAEGFQRAGRPGAAPWPARAYSETDEGALFADEMARRGYFD